MELVLPSSPVWYQTKASDTSLDGYFAFASRSLIYLLDIRQDVPLYYGILSGHEERVTTCAFCQKKPNSQFLRLASGGDDCVVKVWNVMTKTVTNESSPPGIGKITALHWSPFSENIIVYGDEKGCLVLWNFGKGSTIKYFPDGCHQQISCVVCSHNCQNFVAVGYKSGAVSIVDINNKGMVVRKFRGHGNEIHSIVWSYLPREDLFQFFKSETKSETDGKASNSPQNQLEGIVVSGSKDRTIRIWSLMKGKGVKILKLPSRPSKGRRTGDDNARIFVALYWPEGSESTFLSSSFNGDLLMWDLTKPDKEMHQVLSSQSPDSGHQRVVFNISAGLNPRSSVITTSMDRQIKLWSLSNPQSPPTCSLPTLGGYVYAIEISPIDPSILALGVGDGAIRLWKTKNPRNSFDVTVLWQGVKEKVMSLAWHREREGILAFGTEDGKVGLYDVLSMKPPVISETYHMKPVYAISWGPKCHSGDGDVSNTITSWLYTCGGEGVIMMHPPDLKGDGVDVFPIITDSNPDHTPGRRSEVAWRKDGKVVAMGNDNGSYDVYIAPCLRHLVTVKIHNKIINCLRWRPNNVGEQESGWLASGSVNSNVCVANIEPLLNEESQTSAASKPVITEPYRSLSGHTSRITGLSWNQNNTFQLVSASYDGTVQVWDVREGVGLANYRGHDGRTLCVEWSPIIDGDSKSGLIYSGGDDYSVHVWKAEKQENKLPPKELMNVGFTQKQSSLWKKKNKKKKSNYTPVVQETVEARNVTNDVDIDVLLEKKKKELLADMRLDKQEETNALTNGDFANEQTAQTPIPSGTSCLNPHADPFPTPPSDEVKEVMLDLSENRAAAMETKDEEKMNKRRRVKNLFPLSIALDNQKKEIQQLDCIDIVKYKNNKSLDHIPDRPNLGLYGDRRSTYRMLYKEDEKLAEMDNHFGSQTLKVWRGDVLGAIESAIERNELTDHIVAMAPMAGHDVWLRACTSFADQLTSEGYHLHAANYLMACNKVSEAIILLRENKHYREAVAMARARLHDKDPLLIETVKVWANRLKCGSSYEMASKCFASIEEYRLAADCISERARSKTLLGEEDLHSLFAAALLAKSAGLPNHHSYLRHALLDVATFSGRWASVHVAARKFTPDLKCVRLLAYVHEVLCVCASSSLERERFSLDEFSDPLSSDWGKGLTVMCSDFSTILASIKEKVISENSSKCGEVLVSDVESLCSFNFYTGLTIKQSLYKASTHLLCVLLHAVNFNHDIMQSLQQHLKSFLSDAAGPLMSFLEEIYQSVDSVVMTFDTEKVHLLNGSNHELPIESDVINTNVTSHENNVDIINVSDS